MTQPNEPQDEFPSGAERPAATPQWPSQPAAEPGAQQPFAPPPVYGPFPQTSNSAVVALVLAIGAWFVCPIIPAIVALVFANKADKEIAAGNGWVTGGGLVTASKIVAWINIGFWAAILLVFLLFAILLGLGGAFSTL